MTSAGLDLDRSERLHRLEWRLQRIGWWAWGAILLAAAAGLLGPGLLGRTTVANQPGSLTIKYDPAVRHHAVSALTVRARTRPSMQKWSLQIDRSLLDGVEVKSMQPGPNATVLASDSVRFVYELERNTDVISVTLHLQPEVYGRLAGRIAANDQEGVAVSLFVLP
jgi:hypothetical protein